MSSFLVVLEEYQPSAAPIEIVPLFDVTDCPVFSGPLGHVHKALYPGLFGIAWNIPCHIPRSLNDHCHIPSICETLVASQRPKTLILGPMATIPGS